MSSLRFGSCAWDFVLEFRGCGRVWRGGKSGGWGRSAANCPRPRQAARISFFAACTYVGRFWHPAGVEGVGLPSGGQDRTAPRLRYATPGKSADPLVRPHGRRAEARHMDRQWHLALGGKVGPARPLVPTGRWSLPFFVSAAAGRRLTGFPAVPRLVAEPGIDCKRARPERPVPDPYRSRVCRGRGDRTGEP